MNINIGFLSHHVKFLGNSHIQQWKVRVQMISEGSACQGTNFGVQTDLLLSFVIVFLGQFNLSRPQYSHL